MYVWEYVCVHRYPCTASSFDYSSNLDQIHAVKAALEQHKANSYSTYFFAPQLN